MCIVGGVREGHGPGAAHVGVAQLVGQLLQLIRLESEEKNDRYVKKIIISLSFES